MSAAPSIVEGPTLTKDGQCRRRVRPAEHYLGRGKTV
jgi:hypothetical protein